jgi:ABC-2 type transport system permease protein
MNRRSWLTIATFVKLSTKRFFRDRLAIFFTVIFPLIFLFVFGSINSGGNSDISFKVAVINQSESSFAKDYASKLDKDKVFEVNKEINSLDSAKELMNRGELDAAVILPGDFGNNSDQGFPKGEVNVYYTQNNEQAGRTISTVLEGQLKEINSSLVQAQTPFTIKSQQTNDRSLTAFDYTFAGLIGFAIIGLGVFGPVNVFPELKKQGILRRLHTTPLKVWQYFVANALSQTIVGLMTLSILFIVSILVFDLKVVGNLFELALFIAISIISILGIGLAVGGWASNERQAAPLSNIIVFPMIFLSGTFFPRFLMPEWLQQISTFLPLTPVIDGIRLITTEGKHLLDIGPQVGLILAWTVVIYIIAFRVFKWE